MCTGVNCARTRTHALPLSSPIQGADGSYSVRETRERRALAWLTGSGAGLIDMQAAPLQSGKSERCGGRGDRRLPADSDGHMFITPLLPAALRTRNQRGDVFGVEPGRRFLSFKRHCDLAAVACVHSEHEMIHGLISCF